MISSASSFAPDNWKPLDWPHDIAPGSALDFSASLDGPAGKYGHLIVRGGKFVFEGRPDQPVRFYGINLCGASNFPDKETCHRLVNRLAACGYNSVRFHHHDKALTQSMDERATQLDPVEMDKLDYLFHCMKERGLYLTTDLYVSRPTREVFPALGRPIKNWEEFKFLIHLLPEAHQNWEDYAGNFLRHVNPYTGLAWKDDPALVTLSCVNEDAIFHCYKNAGPDIRQVYDKCFAAWLEKKGLPEPTGELRTAALNRFLMETQSASFKRMRAFIDSLGCKTLITDQNHWSIIPMALLRENADYVDDHFYCDHPEHFPLPSKLMNESALADLPAIFSGIFPGRKFGMPYTISEFNWVYPNRFRAESGPLTAAYAALQDWDGLYRFDYTSKPEGEEMTGGYFNIAADPINFLSDRIGLMLFLRGDVQASKLAVPTAVSSAHMKQEIPVNTYADPLWKLGFMARIGNVVERDGQLTLPAGTAACLRMKDNLVLKDEPMDFALIPTDTTTQTIAALRETCNFGAGQIDLNGGVIRSTTGELELNENARTFKIVTARSEVFSFGAGGRQSGAVVTADNRGGPAVVAITALDERTLNESGRILVIHLTDALHHNTKFVDNVVEAWGTPPHLVRGGEVDLLINLAVSIAGVKVWALDMSGNRVREVACDISRAGIVAFLADTLATERACLLYEIVRPSC